MAEKWLNFFKKLSSCQIFIKFEQEYKLKMDIIIVIYVDYLDLQFLLNIIK